MSQPGVRSSGHQASPGGGPVVDPDLVEADDEGDGVAAGRHQGRHGALAVSLVHLRFEDVEAGRPLVAGRFLDGHVLDEGHGPQIKPQGHQEQLDHAPGAEDGAADGRLGPADLDAGDSGHFLRVVRTKSPRTKMIFFRPNHEFRISDDATKVEGGVNSEANRVHHKLVTELETTVRPRFRSCF